MESDAVVTQDTAVSVFLKNAFAQAKSRRASLSLRQIAQRLDISASYLSKILNGSKDFPAHLIAPLVEVLNFDLILEQEFLAAIEKTNQQKRLDGHQLFVRNDSEPAPLQDYQNLGSESYWLLEHWYLIAILNLSTLPDFLVTAESVAERLGISLQQSREGLGTLLEKGFLSEHQGRLERTQLKVRYPTNKSHERIRSFHEFYLRKAAQELKSGTAEDFESRLITGVSFAGDSSRLKEARMLLEKEIYKIADFMAAGECDEIYHLGTQLFSLSQKPTLKK